MREKLSRLKLEGYRSIRQLDLTFGDITVLIGANGSGKSNLVSFFRLLQAAFSEGLKLYVAQQGFGSSLLHYGVKQTSELSASLVFDGPAAGEQSNYSFRLAHAAPDSLVYSQESVEFQRLGHAEPFHKALRSGDEETQLIALENSPEQSTLRSVARVFSQRLRKLRVYHFHDTSERSVIRLSQDLQDNQELSPLGANLAAYLYRLKQTHPGHYSRIVNTARLAIPYFQDFVLQPEALNPSRIQLRWKDRSADYVMGTNHLSDGSLRVIALLTALQQPEELMPTMIIIDEPELGLHPAAIGLVASLIKEVSSKRQVLLATQSPKLLSEFEPDEVVVTERIENASGQGESTFRRLSKEELGDWIPTYSLGALYEMNVTGGGPQ